MRFPHVPDLIVRLRVTPDEPEPATGPGAIVAVRPQGSRRPHTAVAVAKVNRAAMILMDDQFVT